LLPKSTEPPPPPPTEVIVEIPVPEIEESTPFTPGL
jgi:hypothetical protein